MTRFLEPYNFANGKSMTVCHDLDEFVTERMARFITGRHAQAVPNACGQADNPKVVVVPQDHQTEVTPVVTLLHENRGILPAVAWFSGVSRRMVAMIAAGVLVVLVALGYLLLRGQAAGHDHAANRQLESDKQAYEKWVNGFATGLGDWPAVVILEPDALAQLNGCLDNAQRQARLQMLSYAVKTLQTTSDQVYLDAGHSNWVPAGQMAARLRAADVAQAYGFALNVSNFDATGREIGYATELDRDLGMAKRFVVDTSRNRKGSAGGRVHPAVGSSSGATPSASGGAPASQLFSDPYAQAANWVRAHPGDPRVQEIVQRIANQPTAKWFGAWSGDITAAVSGYTLAASTEHKLPVL